MNHDYAHCLDFSKDCPKDCFRAKLTKDLKENAYKYAWKEWDWMSFKGTKECKRKEE